jgi:hypothetical protein
MQRPSRWVFACALAVFSLAAVTASASIERIDRDVTIAVDRPEGIFYGHVHSPQPSRCAEGARVYVLQKRKGPDKRLAGTFASVAEARWHVTLGGQDGHRLYAKVPRLVKHGKHGTTICRATVSPALPG